MHSKIILNNKMPVVYQKLEGYKSVSVGVWIKTGSINESVTNNGISHFIEHMLFKGTTKRDAKTLAYEIDRVGGEINAFTTRECICVYSKVLASDLEVCLDVLSDMIYNSTFEDHHIDTEKNVIIDEINMYDDSAEDIVDDLLMKVSFGDHPIAYPVLGTKETVGGFSRQMLLDYFSEFFTPDNMVLAIAGGYEEETFEKLIHQYFDLNLLSEQKIINHLEKPIQYFGEADFYKDNEQIQVSIDFPGLEYDDERGYDLMLLSNIIGGTNSSRLFQKVREELGLVYSIYASPSFYDDIGTFNINFGVSKENVGKAIDAIGIVLKEIITHKIESEEFEHAKSHFKGHFILGLESTDEFMDMIGRIELFGQKEKNYQEMMAKIESIDLEIVNTLIDYCFGSRQFGIAIVGDVKNGTAKAIKDRLKKVLD